MFSERNCVETNIHFSKNPKM